MMNRFKKLLILTILFIGMNAIKLLASVGPPPPPPGPAFDALYGFTGGWYFQIGTNRVLVDNRGMDAKGVYWFYQ